MLNEFESTGILIGVIKIIFKCEITRDTILT